MSVMSAATLLPLSDMHLPQIIVEEKDYLVVYKPPRMHSNPLPRSGEADTLLHWCALRFPETAELPGRRAGEGGLLHRLDYETQGLLLLARTPAGMEFFLKKQNEGKILKEYSALTRVAGTPLPGFPAQKPGIPRAGLHIQSAFRPYGPGRKAVRPVTDGVPYVTTLLEAKPLVDGLTAFRPGIRRGFRHQIRCHLAWLGMPIVNDALYGGEPFGAGLLGLRACSLLFCDMAGREQAFSIAPIESGEV